MDENSQHFYSSSVVLTLGSTEPFQRFEEG